MKAEFSVKNELALFDSDQTYDLIYYERVDIGVNSLLYSYFGNRFITPGLFTLVERYTLDDYEWAEDWVTKVYTFIRKLSKTWLLNNGELNGSAYGFVAPYSANLPASIQREAFPAEIVFTVKADKEGSISYLEREYAIASRHEIRVVANINVFRKVTKNFKATDEDTDFTLQTENIIGNSLILIGEDISIKDFTDEQKEIFLYDFLEISLEAIDAELGIPDDCRLLTTVTANVRNRLIFAGDTIESLVNNRGQACSFVTPGFNDTRVYFTNPVYTTVPESYCNSFLVYANNPIYKIETKTFTDKDDVFFVMDGIHGRLTLDTNFDYFSQWIKGIWWGYNQIQEPFSNKNIKVVQIDIDGDISLFSIKNNQPASGAWATNNFPSPMVYLPTIDVSYPPLHQTQITSGNPSFRGVFQASTNNTATVNVEKRVGRWHLAIEKGSWAYLGTDRTSDALCLSDVQDRFADIANYKRVVPIVTYIPFLATDLKLFDNGQVGLLNSNAIAEAYMEKIFPSDAYPTARTATWSVHKINGVITIEYGSNPELEPTIGYAMGSSTVTELLHLVLVANIEYDNYEYIQDINRTLTRTLRA